MSAEDRLLRVELRYRLGLPAADWRRVLDALLAWEPSLRPQRLDRLSDPASLEQEDWNDAFWAELAHRLAGDGEVSWLLSRLDDERVGMMASRTPAEVELSVGVRPDALGPRRQIESLLAVLAQVSLPALAMACAGGTPDAEVVLQGLRGLKQAPPLLYLDRRAAALAGGYDRLLAAPCEAAAVPGGVLLVVRPAFWWPPAAGDAALGDAVARYLGLTPDHPLVLLP